MTDGGDVMDNLQIHPEHRVMLFTYLDCRMAQSIAYPLFIYS